MKPPDKRIVRVEAHTDKTSTPVEVAFCVIQLNAGSFTLERRILELVKTNPNYKSELTSDSWGNHLGRVMLKAMLEPERLSPIDLVESYKRESTFRGHNQNEESFFANFAEQWGVVERS